MNALYLWYLIILAFYQVSYHFVDTGNHFVCYKAGKEKCYAKEGFYWCRWVTAKAENHTEAHYCSKYEHKAHKREKSNNSPVIEFLFCRFHFFIVFFNEVGSLIHSS